MAEQKPSSQNVTAEEDQALDELLAGEQAASDGSVKAARADEEAEALEELLSGESSGREPVKDDEDQALDDLVAAEDDEAIASGQRQGASVAESADDGIITLKEVVALGGVSAEETLSEEDQALDALMGADESLAKQGAGAETQSPPMPAVEQAAEGMEISGLSREEKDDLDKLIKGLKEEPPAGVSPAAIADIQKQVKAMRKRVIQLTRFVAEYDKKMKACSEIMRLFYEKSEIMNERIDAIADSAKGGKKG